jgi:DNA-binding Lrp family transcriptional regulator
MWTSPRRWAYRRLRAYGGSSAEREGYKKGDRAVLRRDSVGLGFSVFNGVKIDGHANQCALKFEGAVSTMPEVIACHFARRNHVRNEMALGSFWSLGRKARMIATVRGHKARSKADGASAYRTGCRRFLSAIARGGELLGWTGGEDANGSSSEGMASGGTGLLNRKPWISSHA